MWRTKEGQVLAVSEMTPEHRRNALKHTIRNYTLTCLSMGACYNSTIRVDEMSDEAVQEMLTQVCTDPKPLKVLVAEQCFGPDTHLENGSGPLSD